MAEKNTVPDTVDALLDGAILSAISNYQLERNDGRLYIVVHEILSSPLRGKFLAVPTITDRDGDAAFIGEGATSDDALRECLRKLHGVSFSRIFPHQ